MRPGQNRQKSQRKETGEENLSVLQKHGEEGDSSIQE